MNNPPSIRRLRCGLAVMFALGAVALAATALAGYSGLRSLLRNNERKSHIQLAIDHLSNLWILLNEVETRERDYLIRGDPHNLQLFRTSSAEVRRQLHLLEVSIGDQADQRQELQSLEPLIEARFGTLNDSIQVRTQMGTEAAFEMLRSGDGHPSADGILQRIDSMINEERSLLAQPAEGSPANNPIRTVAGASLAGFLILSLTGLCTFQGLTALRTRIAELAQREGGLQTQVRFMDAVLEGMDDGVVLLDSDMKVIRCNSAAEQLLKPSRSRLLGELTAQLEPASPEVQLPLGSRKFQIAAQGSIDLPPTKLNIRSPDDPTLAPIAATGTTLRDETGKLQGGVLLVRDMTERISMRNRLEANEAILISLFQFGLEAAFITTLEDAVCIGANDGFLRLSGCSQDEIVGWPIEQVSVFGGSVELRDALAQARSGQIVRARAGFRARSGRVFDAVLSVLPIELDGTACLLFTFKGVEWRGQPSRLLQNLVGTLSRFVG